MTEVQVSSDLAIKHQAMQLVMDRTFKAMLAEHTESALRTTSTPPVPPPIVVPLSMHEKNAIRYMAGFVMLKLKKKFSKKLKSGIEKRKWFVKTLNTMRAGVDTMEDRILTVEDYTRFWVEQVDRGGLFHVSDKVITWMSYKCNI